MLNLKPPAEPRLWPTFDSPLRSTALTARLGRLVGICFGVCFLTGMLSHYQYHPWSWLPAPANPIWGYRLTQGLHVATGTAAIPLLLVKLWSVYPNLFQWPPVRSIKNGLERASVAVLVSAALVELFTGFFNALNWYPWPWEFVPVHRYLAYVVIGSIMLHIAVKLPYIKYGLSTRVADGDVLTETVAPETARNENLHSVDRDSVDRDSDDKDSDDGDSDDNDSGGGRNVPSRPTGLSRRGVLTAAGAGVGVVVITSVGQTVTALEPVGLLAIRQSKKGPQQVPINRTAQQAKVAMATAASWRLTVNGPKPYSMTLAEVEAMAEHEAGFPISCVEGWSVGAQWRGMRLIDVITRAGGDSGSRIKLVSLEKGGSYHTSFVAGPQLEHALLATHLNGARIDLDHGYPLRLIAPDRPGVLNTKWLALVEVL